MLYEVITGHAQSLGRSVLLEPFHVLFHGVDGGRSVGRAAAGHAGTDRTAAFHADAPLVHGLA